MKNIKIDYSVLRDYLKNIYFINGTAYAGKSTVCKALAKKYGMVHCEENYQLDKFLSITSKETHPNLHYFNTMESWEAFVTRSKEEYTAWMDAVSEEMAPLELIELIHIAKDQRVIVDTNIPIHILEKVAGKDRVVFMVASENIAMEEFFNRPDEEKQFLLNIIKSMKNPEQVLAHFKKTIAYANSEIRINAYKNTCFPWIERKNLDDDIEDKITQVERLFKLSE